MQRFLLVVALELVAARAQAQAPAPELARPPAEPSPPIEYRPPPPAPLPAPEDRYAPPKTPVHAPRFAIWTGARLSYATFGNGFFRNERGQTETTGNFVRPGLGTEIDLGARLERRYLAYVTVERITCFGAGHRFLGQGGSAFGQFYGFGARYVIGDPDFVAGFVDLSFGRRSVHVSSRGQAYSMSTFEFLRLGLGAEIRLTSYLVVSPQLGLTSGVMSATSGDVTYAPQRQGDGLSHPRYVKGASIGEAVDYIVLGAGVGAHFDLFGH